jgi:hypothetical protein
MLDSMQNETGSSSQFSPRALRIRTRVLLYGRPVGRTNSKKKIVSSGAIFEHGHFWMCEIMLLSAAEGSADNSKQLHHWSCGPP